MLINVSALSFYPCHQRLIILSRFIIGASDEARPFLFVLSSGPLVAQNNNHRPTPQEYVKKTPKSGHTLNFLKKMSQLGVSHRFLILYFNRQYSPLVRKIHASQIRNLALVGRDSQKENKKLKIETLISDLIISHFLSNNFLSNNF